MLSPQTCVPPASEELPSANTSLATPQISLTALLSDQRLRIVIVTGLLLSLVSSMYDKNLGLWTSPAELSADGPILAVCFSLIVRAEAVLTGLN